ncbi:MAG TPA: aspartate 1-decarboxylase [Candidatus Sulfotelmatobacter sp.]|nr:aspartate 1-decarboxylase [Candidatus Sulfotelmatobacter sp.]
MFRIVLKSKIHRATVTRVDLDYEGSCSIAEDLMRQADLLPGEQVHVANVGNGNRGVTYAIPGAPGEIGLNGAMAHLGKPGDTVILMSYVHLDDVEARRHRPTVVRVDGRNRIIAADNPVPEPSLPEKVIVH